MMEVVYVVGGLQLTKSLQKMTPKKEKGNALELIYGGSRRKEINGRLHIRQNRWLWAPSEPERRTERGGIKSGLKRRAPIKR